MGGDNFWIAVAALSNLGNGLMAFAIYVINWRRKAADDAAKRAQETIDKRAAAGNTFYNQIEEVNALLKESRQAAMEAYTSKCVEYASLEAKLVKTERDLAEALKKLQSQREANHES